jgi:hypothetical protein
MPSACNRSRSRSAVRCETVLATGQQPVGARSRSSRAPGGRLAQGHAERRHWIGQFDRAAPEAQPTVAVGVLEDVAPAQRDDASSARPFG